LVVGADSAVVDGLVAFVDSILESMFDEATVVSMIGFDGYIGRFSQSFEFLFGT
jgi:hypothetical protein